MRRSSTLAVFAAFALLSTTALADPTAADRATARTLAQEGQQALESKNFAVAIDKFGRADSLIHAPTLLLGLARAQVGLGKLVEAQESYNRIIRDGVAPGAPRSWTKALDDANREVAALPGRLPWVTITVLGPTNPEVVIDSTPIPPASLGVKRPVNPGTHTIRVSAEGYAPAEKAITMSEGQTLNVNLELDPLPTTDSSQAAKKGIVMSSDTGASSGDARKYIAYGVLGLGGAGIIVGGVAGVLAIRKRSELATVCPGSVCPPEEAPARDSYRTLGTISTVGFIVGGVGTAAGIVLLLTQPESTQTGKAATMIPFIGIGGAGVTGTF